MKRRGSILPRLLAASLLSASVLVAVCAARAQEGYPSKPIRYIINIAPGGYGDISTRAVAQKMGDSLGQRVIVENRPGAGHLNSMQAALQVPADGYTIVSSGGGIAVTTALYKKLPYDFLRDFEQISPLVSTDLVLFVKADSRFSSIADVLKYAKANPGKLNIGTSYIGSTQYLGAEIFKKQAGIDALIVPYKSPVDVVVALRSGALDIGFDFLATTLAQIKDKAIRGLAIAGDKRFSGLPDLPTTEEAGFPGFEVASWNGACVRAGTPRPIFNRLHKEVIAALNAPDVKKTLQDLGLNPLPLTPEQTRAKWVAEVAQWNKIIDDAKIPRQ